MKSFIFISIIAILTAASAKSGDITKTVIFGHFESNENGTTKFINSGMRWQDNLVIFRWRPDVIVTKDINGHYICSGKLHDFNVGIGGEGVPLFWGSNEHLPRLIAITNNKGRFSFTIPPKNINNQFLYVSGVARRNPKTRIANTQKVTLILSQNSPTARYPMNDLISQATKMENKIE